MDEICPTVCRVSAASTSASKPIVAARIKFHGTPVFGPRPYFPQEYCTYYDSPSSLALEYPPDPPRCVLSGYKTEVKKLLRKIDASQRLKFVPSFFVSPELRHGIHCVYKDPSFDRLITIDARPPNSQELALNFWTKTLGSPFALAGLMIPDSSVLSLYANDVKDFYYQFVVSLDRARRNAFAAELSHSEACEFASFPNASEIHLLELDFPSKGQPQNGPGSLASLLCLWAI